MKPKNFPTLRNPNVIRQFLGFNQELRAVWLPSMAFALLVAALSEDENEDPDVVERKYLELTGFALGLPNADVAATIEYIQNSKDKSQN